VTTGRHALVDGLDGRTHRAEQVHDGADLAPVRSQTAPADTFKVVDVAGLYHHPPQRAVVLRVDEKSRMQALGRSQPVLPMMPSMPERRTHDHARHGTTPPACSRPSTSPTAPSSPN
jgi:hypothetical protein